MRNIRLLILFAALSAVAFAYQYPINGVKGLHSASFAEMRPNHFHSGIDIKTDGRQGKEVVAVEDGYISRVIHSPYGYGLALYVTHPKRGSVTVYGHLSRFTNELEKFVHSYRYSHKVNSVDITFQADKYPVKRGEVIGYSGNTGNSFGPHLHFELRNREATHTYNVVRRGYFSPKDDISPRLLRLHYIEVDTLDGVAVEAHPKSYTLTKKGDKYIVTEPVRVGRSGYFLLECRDNQSGNKSSRFGVYRVEQKIDGQTNFRYQMDGFAFDDTRLCNLVSHYDMQRGAKCEVIRLAQVAGAPLSLYNKVVARGAIMAVEAERKNVVVEVEDDCGNISKLMLSVVGKPDNQLFTPVRDCVAVVAGAGKRVVVEDRWARSFIGKDALYAPTFCRVEATETRPDIPGVVVLSNRADVLDNSLPMKGAMTVVIDTQVPLELQTKCCVALRNRKGYYNYLGGYYAGGKVYVRSRSGGQMVVVADTVAPAVVPKWNCGDNLSKTKRLVFKVSDNFSGISNYELYIDGEWKTLNYSPLQATLYHPFDTPLAAGKGTHHTVRLKLKDAMGNIKVWRGEFYR